MLLAVPQEYQLARNLRRSKKERRTRLSNDDDTQYPRLERATQTGCRLMASAGSISWTEFTRNAGNLRQAEAAASIEAASNAAAFGPTEFGA